MIGGLCFDYAQARLAARLGQRPDERLWAQLHAARSVAALLERARAGAAAPLVSGVSWPSTFDAVEGALRNVLRARIREVTGWVPEPWRAAVLWTSHLVDLPALVHLASDQPPPDWIAQDPPLSAWIRPTRAERVAAMRRAALAPIAAAIAGRPAQAAAGPIHPALQAWRDAWHARWPDAGEAVVPLLQLERLVLAHVARFGGVPLAEAGAARAALGRAALALWRQHPAGPVGPFAALVLFALDVERIRAELAPRAVAAGAAAVH